MLEIAGLSKVYDTGTVALKEVSFTVDQPQIVAIIGPSGAGKSTLIRCINRLVEPTAGKVMLGDLDILSLSRRELRHARRRMGMIFQEYNLVERLTVMENLFSGRLGYVSFWKAFRRKFPPEDIASAFKLLDRVGLSGYQDTRADALSGGERQRVGISRALMQQPDVLLVDEPTASLEIPKPPARSCVCWLNWPTSTAPRRWSTSTMSVWHSPSPTVSSGWPGAVLSLTIPRGS